MKASGTAFVWCAKGPGFNPPTLLPPKKKSLKNITIKS
jgi:hypothetical protein